MAPAKPSKTPSKPAKGVGKDIRMFFNNGSSQPTSQNTPSGSAGPKKPDVIAISDDEAPREAPKQARPAHKRHNDDMEVDDERQATKTAPKRAKPTRTPVLSSDDDAPLTKPPSPAKPTLKRKSMAVLSSDEEAAPTKKPSPVKPAPKRKKPSALLSSEEEDAPAKKPSLQKKAATATASSSTASRGLTSKAKPSKLRTPASAKRKSKNEDDYEMEEDEDEEDEDDYEEEEAEEEEQKAPPKKSSTKGKAPVRPTAKTTPVKSNAKGKAEAEADPPKKFNWAAAKAAKLAGPSAPGSKPVPEPASEDCLAGLAFVFTGELSSFSRDEAVDLAKRYGGRVVGQPSSKTDYVVLGDNAGPRKLEQIKKFNLKAISEDEFLNIIATRKGPGNGKGIDPKIKKKLEKEQEAIRLGAKELEKREQTAAKGKAVSGNSKIPDASSQLWTTRYAPQTLKEICGNKGQVEKLQQWLHDWPQSLKAGFKKPGKSGMNIYRAVLITGSPGIGKTTSAHLCAKLEGFLPIELNASDARSKKLVENGMNINNTSLDGWMGGKEVINGMDIKVTDRSCLIMDEVDGMSAGDRGGVGALNALIKKTKIPIICIANDRGAQKLKPLVASTYSLKFIKPDAAAVRSRMLTITFKEKMKIPANVVDQLINGAQSDIRQVLNMLSTWKLSSDSMSFDEGKDLAKMNAKYSMMSPFDITNKMLGPYLFSSTSRETLGDKMELYFHDPSFVPLFIQENYLKTQPAKIRNLEGPEKQLKLLEMMDRAASSISDGDLVDALIHGPEQHWALMPLHAVCSAVRPSSFLYGQGAGYGGPNAMSFPQWLGQNSKQSKLNRQLSDVQIRMRLKVSGDKSEIRQSYLPALVPHIVRPLIDDGASAVDDIIERMDEYYLSKDDWDTVVELGVGDARDEVILKQIPTATKTALTRKYNAREHPIAFHKAQDLGKAPRQIAGAAVPDIEDAFELDEVVEDVSEDEKGSGAGDDISGDKLIQAKKKKAVPKARPPKTAHGFIA